MRFCVSHSSTHEVFLRDFFLKSFPFEEGVSLHIEQVPQKCESGNLFSDGWRNQMIEKQKSINNTLDLFRDEILVFCDVDIAFYHSVKDDLTNCLGDNDIAFMKNGIIVTLMSCFAYSSLRDKRNAIKSVRSISSQ